MFVIFLQVIGALIKVNVMRISILCSDENHPVNDYLNRWMMRHAEHDIVMCRHQNSLLGGDLLFLVSCCELVRSAVRAKFKKVLIIHASDLPKGRGWSPYVWQIINGCEQLQLTLLEAEKEVDTGAIWEKISLDIPRDTLHDEIYKILFEAECRLMDFAVAHFSDVVPVPQSTHITPSYYQKREPHDSRLDPYKNIAEQFDLMRVCDPERYPAYFHFRGCMYRIRLDKI